MYIFATALKKRGKERKQGEKAENYCHLLAEGRTNEERRIRKRRKVDGQMDRCRTLPHDGQMTEV